MIGHDVRALAHGRGSLHLGVKRNAPFEGRSVDLDLAGVLLVELLEHRLHADAVAAAQEVPPDDGVFGPSARRSSERWSPMLRLGFFGSRRFLPNFARRLPRLASARLLRRAARKPRVSMVAGKREGAKRFGSRWTMFIGSSVGEARCASIAGSSCPEALDADRKPGAQKPLCERRRSPGAIPEKSLAGVIVGSSRQRPACQGRRRRDCADFRSCAPDDERRPLDAAGQNRLLCTRQSDADLENSKLARKHESVRYRASGLSDREDR